MRRHLVSLIVILSALAPASAGASAYTSVLHTYQAYGSVPPCQFSSAQLAAALRGVDAYGQQYFADFSDALQSALAARAAGACIHGHQHTARASQSLAPVPLPPSPTSSTKAGLPLPILLMAVLALLLAATAGARALARSLGWSPPWAAAWHHAFSEAGFRAGGLWSDASDWVRRR